MPQSYRRYLKTIICIRCKIEKPILEFYTYNRKFNNKIISSVFSDCKKCHKEKSDYRRYNYPSSLLYEYKKNAKVRNLIFELDLEYFIWLKNQPCYYCGQFVEKNKKMGIDRIINTIGYIKDNCVPCCRICNQAKWKLTENEFIEHCNKIVRNHPLKTNTNPLNKEVS